MDKVLIVACVLVVTLWTATGDAQPILMDINQTGKKHHAAAADFSAAGVKEDLTGAGVIHVEHLLAHGNRLEGGGLTLSFSSRFRGAYHLRSDQAPTGNALLDDYVYLWDSGALGGPAEVTITGLADKLAPRTVYKLYLFGAAGKNAGQTSQFEFPSGSGTKKTAALPPPPSKAAVVFFFITGDKVDDTLRFKWTRPAKNSFGAFNGFAIISAMPVSGPT